jgi:hypothetical protein
MGVQRTLVAYGRRRILSSDEPRDLAAEVRKLGESGFALLEEGLRDYAPKPANGSQEIVGRASQE